MRPLALRAGPPGRRRAIAWIAAASAAFATSAADAQDAPNAEALAKKLANPITSMISVPLQLNYDEGVGPTGDGSRTLMNFQPVVPISIAPDWNLISRTVVPVVSLDPGVPGLGSDFGFGDVLQSLFLSPKEPGPYGVIWGLGPVIQMGTSTEPTLGAGSWGLGPTAVALRQSGPWTYGMLANHVWSVAGTGGDVNATYMQPFLNYTTRTATSFVTLVESSYDWNADEAATSLNVQVAQMLKLGAQPIQIGAGVRWWPEAPDNGPSGLGARLTLVFLFPK